jgi:hypothetical protein
MGFESEAFAWKTAIGVRLRKGEQKVLHTFALEPGRVDERATFSSRASIPRVASAAAAASFKRRSV